MDLEAFVSSPWVGLSIRGNVGEVESGIMLTSDFQSPMLPRWGDYRKKPGVLLSGDYERLAHYNYRGIEWNTLVDELTTLLQEQNVPIKGSERKSVTSDYPEASGEYHHFIFDKSVDADALARFFESLNGKYPKAY